MGKKEDLLTGIDMSGEPTALAGTSDKASYGPKAKKYLEDLVPTVQAEDNPYDIYEFKQSGPNDSILDLQKRLVLSGYLHLTGVKYQPGVADSLTTVTLAKAMYEAESNGFSLDEWLDAKIQGGGVGPKRGPFMPNAFLAPDRKPLDDKVINLSIMDAFEKEFGRAPNDKELGSFRAAFRAREGQYFNEADTAAQSRFQAQEARRKQLYKAGFDQAGVPTFVDAGTVESGGGVAVGKLPSPGQLTESGLVDTTEAQGYRAAKAGLDLLQLMRGGG